MLLVNDAYHNITGRDAVGTGRTVSNHILESISGDKEQITRL